MPVLKFLSTSAEELLKRDHAKLSRTPPPPGSDQDHHQSIYTPDFYFIKLPTGGIAARNGANLGSANNCQVVKVNSDGEFEDVTGFTLKVYNPFPVKWYKASGVDVYIRIDREKYGSWMCEKPPYVLTVKTDEDTAPDEIKPCSVFINGGDSGDNVDVGLLWMKGLEPILADTEAVAEYRDDYGGFIFMNAECSEEE